MVLFLWGPEKVVIDGLIPLPKRCRYRKAFEIQLLEERIASFIEFKGEF